MFNSNQVKKNYRHRQSKNNASEFPEWKEGCSILHIFEIIQM